MDWILMLALVTFLLFIAFLAWNKVSLQQHQSASGNTKGIGGLNDPLSGTTEGMRDPDEMRADLNAPASSPHTTKQR